MPFLTVDTPLPVVQAAPIIPSNIEIVQGGKQAIYDTTNLDNSGAEKKIEVADYLQTTMGANHFGFRWPRYTYTITYANDKPGQRSEHVSDTVRVDKHGTATAFGRVTEMNDYCGKGPMVGHEVDMRIMPTVSDADAQDNGNRIAFDFIVAGSNDVNDPVREVGATTAIRTSGANPLAYWMYGAWFGAIKDSGLRLESWSKGAKQVLWPIGKWKSGFDFQDVTGMDQLFKLATAQNTTFVYDPQPSVAIVGKLKITIDGQQFHIPVCK